MPVVNRVLSMLSTQIPRNIFHFSCVFVFHLSTKFDLMAGNCARRTSRNGRNSLVYIFKAVFIDECLISVICVALEDILNLESVTNYNQNDWNSYVLLAIHFIYTTFDTHT